MAEDGGRRRHAASAGRAHIQFTELFEQAGARHARQDGGKSQTERYRRQYQVRGRAPARNRQPAQLHGKDNCQQGAEPEIRDADTSQRERHGGMVNEGVLPDRGDDAERKRQQDGHGHGGQREFGGGRHPFGHHLRDRLARAERLAEVARHCMAKKRGVLRCERPVESKIRPQLSDVLRRCAVSKHGLRGVTWHQMNQREHEGRHPEQHRDRE